MFSYRVWYRHFMRPVALGVAIVVAAGLISGGQDSTTAAPFAVVFGGVALADDDNGGDSDSDGGRDNGGRNTGGANQGGNDPGGDRIIFTRPRTTQPRVQRQRRVTRPRRVQRQRPVRRRAVRQRPRVVRAAPVPALPVQIPDELVALNIGAPALAALVADGYTVLQSVELSVLPGPLVRLSVPDGTDLETARQAVRDAAPDAVIDFNHVYTPSAIAECEGLACPNLGLVRWPVTDERANCGNGLTVGMIDTGVNPDHIAFSAADVELISLLDGPKRQSKESHGTAVAALFVGSGDGRIQGLLPQAKLIAVDAFQNDERGRVRSDAFRLVAAMELVLEKGAHVANLSLSGPANAVLEKAVEGALDQDVALVAAVGNEGPRAPAAYPAAYEGVVAVTAIDDSRRVYRRAIRGEHVDFSAPGVKVWTAASLRGAKPRTGTSFAAPFATAALGLAIMKKDGDVDRAVGHLQEMAEDLGEDGRDPVFGWGLINGAGLCGPADPTTPTAAATPPDDAPEDTAAEREG
ncbi:MAG: S8 family serine peptidase [Pseudomonadota bacterium]